MKDEKFNAGKPYPFPKSLFVRDVDFKKRKGWFGDWAGHSIAAKKRGIKKIKEENPVLFKEITNMLSQRREMK
jgi:hypothetical protein